MAAPRRGLFDVADLLDEEPLPRRATINPLNGKSFSPKYYHMLERRRQLPVWTMKEEFICELARRQVVVLHGDAPGSGKTTQIPQFLLEARGLFGRPMIACAQPWRVAAMSVAKRVAEELDVTIGEEVGYSIPFEACTSNRTVIKMMTHDILVREALSSPLLSEYNVIVVDEAQERTLSTDLLLIILKDILKKRIDLKIVVLSSSNEAISFVEHFDQCGIPGVMVVPTITYPVEILYSDEEPRDPVTAAVDKAVEVHLTEPEGDVLLFLPREMIQQACDLIDNALKLMSEKGLCEPFLVVPLFSDLPLEMQDQIFEPAPRLWRVGIRQIRKIIVSTHIAECSLVMDGISYVIDSGIFGHKYYDPVTNLGTVMISEINRKSAIQRSLCAGRARPGRCFRLYNQATFIQLDPEILPEILLCDLASMVLTLMKLGITNLVTVDYLDCPAPQVVINALDALYQLGALDDEARLTIFGELLSQLPLDPQLATALLKSQEFHCANEIISISAMLSVPSCFLRPMAAQQAADEAHAKFWHNDGHHLSLLNVYNAYKQNDHDPQWCTNNFINMGVMRRAESVREKLLDKMTTLGCRIQSPDTNNVSFTNNIKLALLSGFFMQAAHLDQDGNYRTIKCNQVVRIDAELDHEAQPEWVLFNEFTWNDNIDIIRRVTVVTAEMLIQAAPHFLREYPESEAKQAVRAMLINYLVRMNPKRYGFLNHRPFHVVTDALETLQSLVPIRTEVAPPA